MKLKIVHIQEENAIMSQYKTMYYHLYNSITDALRELENQHAQNAAQILIDAQRWGENAYLEMPEEQEHNE